MADAAITTSTERIAETAAPRMNDRPIANSPSMLTTTVIPATTTARPAVSSAATVAASGSSPSARHSRNRVTSSSA